MAICGHMLAILLILLNQVSFGFNLPEVSFLVTIPANNTYVQTLKLPLISSDLKIFVGHPKIGFYSVATENILNTSTHTELRIFPLSYRYPVSFYTMDKAGILKCIYSFHFLPQEFIKNLSPPELEGTFQPPFIYFSARVNLPHLNYKRHYCTLIMNKIGEILACLSPNTIAELITLVDFKNDGQSIVIASPDESSQRTSLLEMNLITNEQIESYLPIESFHPHHQITVEGDHLLALHRQKTTLFPGLKLLGLEWNPIVFWRDSLVDVDLVNKNITPLWRHPINWQMFKYGLVRSNRNNNGLDIFEWTHVNSFVPYKKGWAFSVRDQNAILIHNNDSPPIKIEGHCLDGEPHYFCNQHSVSYSNSEKSFLIFNNGDKDSFAQILKIDEASKKPIWQWESPWHTPRRGSVKATENKSFIALFPERITNGSPLFNSGHLAEVSDSGSIIAQAKLPYKGMSQAAFRYSLAGLKAVDPQNVNFSNLILNKCPK